MSRALVIGLARSGMACARTLHAEGWEVVVSSAYPSVPGRSRAEFVEELVAARRSIVVGGTHGKGTTAAMLSVRINATRASTGSRRL